MRWLLREPSLLAIIFSIFASAFTFLFQWLLGRGRLDVMYSLSLIFIDLALILLYFFGFATVASFVWFIIVVFKKRKQRTDEMIELTTTMKELIMELKSQRTKGVDGK